MKEWQKNIAYILLVVVIAVSWWYGYAVYKNNQAELAIGVADIFNEIALPFRVIHMSLKDPVEELPVPVYGVPLSEVADTWGDARSEGRSHEGTDIFAERGTPVFSATEGYVAVTRFGFRGGENVFVLGPGRVFYYYAHFTRIAEGIEEGAYVTPDTVLGYVGTSGNAEATPPHLHFGVYPSQWEPVNPYPFLSERWE